MLCPSMGVLEKEEEVAVVETGPSGPQCLQIRPQTTSASRTTFGLLGQSTSQRAVLAC
jgi:hypothetical protein